MVDDRQMVAPAVIDAEVLSALRGLERSRAVTPARARHSLATASWDDQMASGSCSTCPGWGTSCGNSCSLTWNSSALASTLAAGAGEKPAADM